MRASLSQIRNVIQVIFFFIIIIFQGALNQIRVIQIVLSRPDCTVVFGVPHSFVQACFADADEDHCMVLCLGIYAVWLSFFALCCLCGVLDSGQLLA